MPREKRQLSDSGIYYVYAKGIFERSLTRSVFDKMKLVACIADAKKTTPFLLYAYCVTKNELHLLLREQHEMDVSKIMKDALFAYTNYYNIKYDETGSLIYDRFKSRPVDEDEVTSVVRYIHQLPVVLNEHQNVFSYEYSSYKHYFLEDGGFVDKTDVLNFFNGTEKEKLSRFKIFHSMFEPNDYRLNTRKNVPDSAVEAYILDVCGIAASEIKNLPINEEKRQLRKLKAKAELTFTQMENALGIPRATIAKL